MNTTIPGNIHNLATNLYDGWLLTALIVIVLSFRYLFRTTENGEPYDVGGIPVLTGWAFFSKRYDFIRDNFKRSGGLPFRFRVLQHRVVAVSGPSARKEFFNGPGLNLWEGYRILLGGMPITYDVANGDRDINYFLTRIMPLLRQVRVTQILPLLIEDIHGRMLEWGSEGVFNPFKEIYDLVFQMTIRMATCRELSQDRGAVEEMADLYWQLEKSATPTAVLLPWIPSPSRKLNKGATIKLYHHLLKYVQDRRAAGAATADAIDALIRNGDSDPQIIQAVLGFVFASVVNTGVTACWAVLYIGLNPIWRQRAISELQSVLSQYCDPSDAVHTQVATIPFSAWEEDLPSVDLIIRETIRMSLGGTFLRLNVGIDVEVEGVKIRKGDFLAYNPVDMHMNSEIYTEPERFDPARFEVGRQEDKKADFGYLGWGGGRHPCPGMKVAKLQLKAMLAMLLLTYQYDVVDQAGVSLTTDSLPRPDRNDIHLARPLGKPAYLKFKRIRA